MAFDINLEMDVNTMHINAIIKVHFLIIKISFEEYLLIKITLIDICWIYGELIKIVY